MFFPAAKRSATGAYLSAHSSTSRVLEYVPDSSIRVRTRDIPVVPEYVLERTYVVSLPKAGHTGHHGVRTRVRTSIRVFEYVLGSTRVYVRSTYVRTSKLPKAGHGSSS